MNKILSLTRAGNPILREITKTYMMADEYRERVAGERRNRAKN